MMFGRSDEASASSSASSWAASPAPKQPVTSKAAEHATITRSALLAKDSQPLLVGAALALPESLFNPMFCASPGYFSRFGHHAQRHRYPLQGSPFPGGAASAYEVQRGTLAKGRSKRGMARHARSLVATTA